MVAGKELKMADDADSRQDVSGTCCPVPLIRLAKSIADLKPGQTIEITGNDPIFEPSIRDFCQAHGHAVLDVTAGADHRVRILIRVGG
jgi:TusA-related sulfurtransferase